MAERIIAQEVRHVAQLARLALDESQLGELADDLEAVLAYFRTLDEIDVNGVEPMAHPMDRVNSFRADDIGGTLDRQVVLSLAPRSEGSHVAVPKVLDGGQS